MCVDAPIEDLMSKNHLDVNLGVHLAQVVHDAVQVELAGSQDDVFARLFHLEHMTRCFETI